MRAGLFTLAFIVYLMPLSADQYGWASCRPHSSRYRWSVDFLRFPSEDQKDLAPFSPLCQCLLLTDSARAFYSLIQLFIRSENYPIVMIFVPFRQIRFAPMSIEIVFYFYLVNFIIVLYDFRNAFASLHRNSFVRYYHNIFSAFINIFVYIRRLHLQRTKRK